MSQFLLYCLICFVKRLIVSSTIYLLFIIASLTFANAYCFMLDISMLCMC